MGTAAAVIGQNMPNGLRLADVLGTVVLQQHNALTRLGMNHAPNTPGRYKRISCNLLISTCILDSL